MKIQNIPTIDKEQINIIIETPKGSCYKFAYDAAYEIFKIKYQLPKGYYFPVNFGFIPQTLADDNDPLDALVFSDDSIPCGVLLRGKIIGALTVEETRDKKTFRNDRILVVPAVSSISKRIKMIKSIQAEEMTQLENFFISYNKYRNISVRFLQRLGPARAFKLVSDAMKNFQNGK